MKYSPRLSAKAMGHVRPHMKKKEPRYKYCCPMASASGPVSIGPIPNPRTKSATDKVDTSVDT